MWSAMELEKYVVCNGIGKIYTKELKNWSLQEKHEIHICKIVSDAQNERSSMAIRWAQSSLAVFVVF